MQVIAYCLRRRACTPEQMLHSIGRLISRIFCELSAVFTFQGTEEPLYVSGRTLARLGTGKTSPNPIGHSLQSVGPLVGCFHGGLVCVHSLPHPILLLPCTGEHNTSAIYNCSTSQRLAAFNHHIRSRLQCHRGRGRREPSADAIQIVSSFVRLRLVLP
jgi:hypothetical protein